METNIIDNNGIVSFDSISSEEDLKLSPRININPPPTNRRCDCCGRHISELKPFGKAGDPCVGDFDGAFLIKKLRPAGPYNRDAEAAYAEATKYFADNWDENSEARKWMIQKYGKEKGEHFHNACIAYRYTLSSWECRDCVVLDEDEYFEKIRLRLKKKNNYIKNKIKEKYYEYTCIKQN